MKNEENPKESSSGFSKPAVYKIKVLGRVPESLIEMMPAIDFSFKTTNKKDVTVLFGHFADQAALAGLLNALYNMHLTILFLKMYKESN